MASFKCYVFKYKVNGISYYYEFKCYSNSLEKAQQETEQELTATYSNLETWFLHGVFDI